MSDSDLNLKLFNTTVNHSVGKNSQINRKNLELVEADIVLVEDTFASFFSTHQFKQINPLKFTNTQFYLNVDICDSETILMLNSQYRAKDKITDVLSFPVHDDLRKTVDPTVTNGGMLLLGDIFICEGVAIEQAKNNGISLRQEISELFIHGMLHLLGYDHEASQVEEDEMYNLEREIFNNFKKLAGDEAK